MIERYKLEYSFGPIGAAAGKLGSLGVLYFMFRYDSNYIISLIFFSVNAFLGFSKSEIFIDSARIRVKYSNTLFGVIPTGKWINIDDNMELGIRKNFNQWQYIGRSNKSLRLRSHSYKIVLYKHSKPLLTLKYANSKEEAQFELEKLCIKLQFD